MFRICNTVRRNKTQGDQGLMEASLLEW
jgi:hypothetical protein